jgi:hyperpolarization activated cyclic nucleotide-gated potassium channel 2
MLWDLLCLSLVIYELISIPLQMSFDINVSEEFSRVSLGIFAFDILLNFNTGIFEDGLLKMNRHAILKDYLEFWFWVDCVSTFPYDIILDESSHFV